MESIPFNQTRSPLEQRYSPLKQWLQDKKSAVTPSLDVGLQSANLTKEGSWGYGRGSLGSTTLNVDAKLPIFSTYQGRHGSSAISLTSNFEKFMPRYHQGREFDFSKSYATAGGVSGSTNIQSLFSQSEKDMFSSDLTTRPGTSKISAGLDFSKTIGNRRSSTTFSAGAGGALTTTGAHLKSEDAGIDKVIRRFNATSHFNTGDQDAYSNTYSRGDTEVFYGGTASNFGNSPGGVTGYTPSGEGVFFGGTGTATQDYFDLVDKYGKSEDRESTNINVYTKQDKKTTFKPYLNLKLNREWDYGNSNVKGLFKASYGTKHSPSSGFSGSIGFKTTKYSTIPNFSFEIGGSKKGAHLGINYLFGGKK